MKRPRSWLYSGLLCGVCIFLFLAGCSGHYTTLQSFLDTPAHHASNGFSFLERGQVSDAEREFRAAIRLDRTFSQAHSGLGLIAGSRGHYQKAFQSMALARAYAKTEEDRAMYAVGQLRLHTMQKGKDWMGHVEKFFEEAVKAKADWPVAYYYLGIALKQAYRLEDAENAFERVKALNSRLFWQATRQAKTVREVIKAMPLTREGMRIALKDTITRAGVAALLVEELKLQEIFRDLAHPKKNTSFSGKIEAKLPASALPPDTKAHPLKRDIGIVLRLGVRGLQCFADGSFRPEQVVMRAEYAQIMGNIITVIKQDTGLKTRFRGKKSPFLDIGNEDPYFNGVMICTAYLHIMEPRQGSFNPWGNISGADAVLALRKLRDALHVR